MRTIPETKFPKTPCVMPVPLPFPRYVQMFQGIVAEFEIKIHVDWDSPHEKE